MPLVSVSLYQRGQQPVDRFSPGGREAGVGGGGGGTSFKRLMGMCRWMGSHFHDWIDYHGVAFSTDLLEWGRTFSDFWGRTVLHLYG